VPLNLSWAGAVVLVVDDLSLSRDFYGKSLGWRRLEAMTMRSSSGSTVAGC
jgi:catechol 2,3-dioxygenase-like lactoylglutathione lyase family enzyme